ncbi:hypothetical protein B0T17DRAFT_508686 [Bombardia bombarda]|uniref:Uncharacterized protein n=1 Tax=Bombardia bombarda TaxID=252184 RepID=A0AA39WTK8_9PEZI|nr:hypothetical protein B0T17DRAFT_508686 [Bombardia bombarda]
MEKGPSSSDFEVEVDSHDRHLQSKLRTIRAVDNARVATTALALLMGLTVMGVSANTLAVYYDTHVPADFLVSLWPDAFNLRPTVALVIGSVIVAVSNIVALCFSKVRVLRNKTTTHTALTFAAPLVGLAAALIAIIFFYTVNASDSVDTFLSWTCRWTAVSMSQSPHWGTLCKQSQAGLYLSIVLIPVEAVALGLAAYVVKAERYTNAYNSARKGSPALS